MADLGRHGPDRCNPAQWLLSSCEADVQVMGRGSANTHSADQRIERHNGRRKFSPLEPRREPRYSGSWGGFRKCLKRMVGVGRFELPAPASRRQCSTRLSYTPCSFKLSVSRLVAGREDCRADRALFIRFGVASGKNSCRRLKPLRSSPPEFQVARSCAPCCTGSH